MIYSQLLVSYLFYGVSQVKMVMTLHWHIAETAQICSFSWPATVLVVLGLGLTSSFSTRLRWPGKCISVQPLRLTNLLIFPALPMHVVVKAFIVQHIIWLFFQ